MTRPSAHVLDTVRLRHPVEGWPEGTLATVVDAREHGAIIEVVTDAETDSAGLPARDLLDDLISVPYEAIQVIDAARVTSA